jgi:hypothetical protein
MTRIPQTKGVTKAIRQVRDAAQRSLKALNQAASQRMKKGDYVVAEALAAKGKEIKIFFSEIDLLRNRWSEISGAQDREGKGAQTPLWAYYQPVLQAIVQNGGKCLRNAVEDSVGRIMKDTFQAKDNEMLSRGRERWRVMVRRARKHLVQEGWLEDTKGKMWIVTEAGRHAAEAKDIQKTNDPN